jgi:pimeloyl-ACP methyl ester carboxylesterase
MNSALRTTGTSWTSAQAIMALLVLASSSLQAQPPALVDSIDIRREPVRFANGDVMLAATLLVPAVERPAPAVVIVHGSGASPRTNPWTSAYAEALARRGIVVLHPDKRGSGESGGDWRTASFEDLARDVAAAVRLLRQRADVDSARVAIVGFSQGGYVVPIVAAEVPEARLAVVISGGTMPLLDQVLDEIRLEAARREAPLDSAELAELRSVYDRLAAFAATRQGWKALQDAATRARGSSERLSHALRTLPGDSTHWVFSWIRHTGNFDPIPYWRRVRQPVLMVYGGRDTQLRPRASIERLWNAVGADAENYSIVLLQGNGHALFRDDVTAMLAEWIFDGGAR